MPSCFQLSPLRENPQQRRKQTHVHNRAMSSLPLRFQILRSKLQVYDFGILCSVRMFGASIDFEFLDHLVTKSAVREHSPNSGLERSGRMLGQKVGKVDPAFAGDMTGVVEVFLLQGRCSLRSSGCTWTRIRRPSSPTRRSRGRSGTCRRLPH